MAKCLYCGKDIASIGTKPKKYCSDRCRKRYVRNVEQTDKRTLILQTDTRKRTSLEKCQYCGIELPRLQSPKKYPGSCYKCAIAQPPKVQPCATAGHTVSSTPIRDSCQSLTAMERLFYKPASELKPGDHNFVSLPGRACYGVFEKLSTGYAQ